MRYAKGPPGWALFPGVSLFTVGAFMIPVYQISEWWATGEWDALPLSKVLYSLGVSRVAIAGSPSWVMDLPTALCLAVIGALAFFGVAWVGLNWVPSDAEGEAAEGVSKEKPGIVGRIGQVIYWIGCALGILAVPTFLLVGNSAVGRFTFLNLGIGIVLGFGFWLVGRGARYILKGD